MIRVGIALLLLIAFSLPGRAQSDRPRAREAGLIVGEGTPGPNNAITDVAGVRVGHATVVEGDSIRTGVTAILPHGENVFRSRVPAAVVVANGFGKLIGATQLDELGELETPILLTCTLCVWKAASFMVDWLLKRRDMRDVRSVNPVVGETNDGLLNDIRAMPIRAEHVVAALERAKSGPVEEGAVGAGAGTVAFGWKGGIGTASRVLPSGGGSYTVGVLVQSNFGGSLTINGAPVGRELGSPRGGSSGDGSIMIVVGTNAPLDSRNLRRLASRALTGLARTGSAMSNGSGDYVIAFSTAESVRRRDAAGPRRIAELPNEAMSSLFVAVAEATEEAIYNSLFKAVTVTSRTAIVPALPIDRTLEVLRKHGASMR